MGRRDITEPGDPGESRPELCSGLTKALLQGDGHRHRACSLDMFDVYVARPRPLEDLFIIYS